MTETISGIDINDIITKITSTNGARNDHSKIIKILKNMPDNLKLLMGIGDNKMKDDERIKNFVLCAAKNFGEIDEKNLGSFFEIIGAILKNNKLVYNDPILAKGFIELFYLGGNKLPSDINYEKLRECILLGINNGFNKTFKTSNEYYDLLFKICCVVDNNKNNKNFLEEIEKCIFEKKIEEKSIENFVNKIFKEKEIKDSKKEGETTEDLEEKIKYELENPEITKKILMDFIRTKKLNKQEKIKFLKILISYAYNYPDIIKEVLIFWNNKYKKDKHLCLLYKAFSELYFDDSGSIHFEKKEDGNIKEDNSVKKCFNVVNESGKKVIKYDYAFFEEIFKNIKTEDNEFNEETKDFINFIQEKDKNFVTHLIFNFIKYKNRKDDKEKKEKIEKKLLAILENKNFKINPEILKKCFDDEFKYKKWKSYINSCRDIIKKNNNLFEDDEKKNNLSQYLKNKKKFIKGIDESFKESTEKDSTEDLKDFLNSLEKKINDNSANIPPEEAIKIMIGMYHKNYKTLKSEFKTAILGKIEKYMENITPKKDNTDLEHNNNLVLSKDFFNYIIEKATKNEDEQIINIIIFSPFGENIKRKNIIKIINFLISNDNSVSNEERIKLLEHCFNNTNKKPFTDEEITQILESAISNVVDNKDKKKKEIEDNRKKEIENLIKKLMYLFSKNENFEKIFKNEIKKELEERFSKKEKDFFNNGIEKRKKQLKEQAKKQKKEEEAIKKQEEKAKKESEKNKTSLKTNEKDEEKKAKTSPNISWTNSYYSKKEMIKNMKLYYEKFANMCAGYLEISEIKKNELIKNEKNLNNALKVLIKNANPKQIKEVLEEILKNEQTFISDFEELKTLVFDLMNYLNKFVNDKNIKEEIENSLLNFISGKGYEIDDFERFRQLNELNKNNESNVETDKITNTVSYNAQSKLEEDVKNYKKKEEEELKNKTNEDIKKIAEDSIKNGAKALGINEEQENTLLNAVNTDNKELLKNTFTLIMFVMGEMIKQKKQQEESIKKLQNLEGKQKEAKKQVVSLNTKQIERDISLLILQLGELSKVKENLQGIMAMTIAQNLLAAGRLRNAVGPSLGH